MAAGTEQDTGVSTVEPLLPPDDRVKPSRLSQLRWSTWWGVLKRSVAGFIDDNCTDWAASLTYYGVLALFPSAVVVIALVGLVGGDDGATDTLLGILRDVLPPESAESLEKPIEEVAKARTPAKVLLSFGVIGALWSASGYVGGFTRASNAIYEVQEGRRWYVLRPLQLAMTAASLALLAILAGALVISGPVAEAVGDALRLGELPLRAFEIGKWPVLLVIASLLLSLLFWIAPNVAQPRFRWLTPGGTVALLAWVVMSAGFGFYVANFGSYDVTYGSLGAVIIFLVWMYLGNCAVMLGVEINAEVERGRQLQVGQPVETGPVLPPRRPADEQAALSPDASEADRQRAAAAAADPDGGREGPEPSGPAAKDRPTGREPARDG
ncbi:MAG TPA: YihY/virulence factor BrkB family protein [Micromonosporaceae bacterium]|nr:YihY/virulence factor BrkB family protein [Micromonosporaceae bacterium]